MQPTCDVAKHDVEGEGELELAEGVHLTDNRGRLGVCNTPIQVQVEAQILIYKNGRVSRFEALPVCKGLDPPAWQINPAWRMRLHF